MEAAECSQCGKVVLVWEGRLADHGSAPTHFYRGSRCPGSGWLVATHDWYRREQENG